ncbi:hypothetical protein [Ketobacter alkanivorans]|uniref:DUF4154 domain-containing protein n=1 Tax=Ketobacter alkanivorans TaxID=1917421 RepID=A0A2K9LPW4_9GAMM|nr:hypothetical protein [Ketobacter alkanivorans]AUM14270.1 hypothetical protein Kalk_18380 [Ketobacter alkanivorans]
MPSFSVLADEFIQRRADVGLKLFRTFVTADLDIESKAQEDQLLVILTYANDASTAQEHQQKLQSTFTSLNNIPVIVRAANIQQILKQTNPKPAALFISQPLNDDERKTLVNYSITQGVIIFSPYEGDVEQGILAGISVQATVRPLINMHTLQKGKFHIKPFYLKVAKHHE